MHACMYVYVCNVIHKSMLFFEACVYKQVFFFFFEACVRTTDVGRTNARPLALRIPIRSRGVCVFFVVCGTAPVKGQYIIQVRRPAVTICSPE